MKWKIEYSKNALEFIREYKIHDQIKNEIKKFLLKLKGEKVNVDLKKLTGEWKGYYRIRKGKLRSIFKNFRAS